jgi:3-hydroxymyristoyl/3-hydroxydecanoyl-(acyl carrier protein) dehydratase
MKPYREQIKAMIQMLPRERGFAARWKVARDFAVFPDHFRDFPILPGMCVAQAILLAAGMSKGSTELRLRRLKNAKLTYPVVPGDELLIEGEIGEQGDGLLAVKARITNGERRCAEMTMIAQSARASVGACP